MLAGCTSLPRYKDAQPKYLLPVPAAANATTVVLLEPVFPGKLFDEIVCDNAIGAMWNPDESRKIGFTQNYADTLVQHGPELLLLAALPHYIGIGMAASGDSGLNVSSRIMVPYGRFITANLAELLAAASPGSSVCLDQMCVQNMLTARPNSRLVTVQFTTFKVAEQKTNKLTLVIEGSAKSTIDGQLRSVPIRHSIVNRSIASEGPFHSDILIAMNKMANEITTSIAQQIYVLATAKNPQDMRRE